MKPFLFLFLLLVVPPPLNSFQIDSPGEGKQKGDPLQLLESGLGAQKNLPLTFQFLSAYEYEKALKAVTLETSRRFPWIKEYLTELIEVRSPLTRFESEHFILLLPSDQLFLKDYVVPVLEKVGAHMEEIFDHRPKNKIQVEIYPSKEDFSKASTLSKETLKRSGAIGICKFHRLMIMSPRTLPLGYRWLDALSHEYIHLIVNELSYSKAELWLHEGTARYFETSYRSSPPKFLSPNQKSKLKEAFEKEELIPFKRMSPSLVYLKDQDEVSLAFSQVSHAVSMLIEKKGKKKFTTFLRFLRKKTFPDAFKRVYNQDPFEFEENWKIILGQADWEKTKGAMSDEIRFESFDEDSLIGANVKGKIRLGDRMRLRGHLEAALIEYEKALDEEPDNAVILLKVARTQLKLGKKEEALRNLERAVEKNPNYGTPHIELAKFIDPSKSIPYLLTANAINPFNPEIHALLARAYRAIGEEQKALREEEISVLLMKN